MKGRSRGSDRGRKRRRIEGAVSIYRIWGLSSTGGNNLVLVMSNTQIGREEKKKGESGG